MQAVTSIHADDRVLLGTRGWWHAGWLEQFYPSGLPEDWLLTFYNTQYGCVFLDEAMWRDVDDATLENWHRETHEHFVFLLEGAVAAPAPAALGARALVLPRDDARILWFDRATDLKLIKNWLTPRGDAPPGTRFLLSEDAHLGQLERVATLLELMGY